MERGRRPNAARIGRLASFSAMERGRPNAARIGRQRGNAASRLRPAAVHASERAGRFLRHSGVVLVPSPKTKRVGRSLRHSGVALVPSPKTKRVGRFLRHSGLVLVPSPKAKRVGRFLRHSGVALVPSLITKHSCGVALSPKTKRVFDTGGRVRELDVGAADVVDALLDEGRQRRDRRRAVARVVAAHGHGPDDAARRELRQLEPLVAKRGVVAREAPEARVEIPARSLFRGGLPRGGGVRSDCFRCGANVGESRPRRGVQRGYSEAFSQ